MTHDVEFLDPASPVWQDTYAQLPRAHRDIFYSPAFARFCAEQFYPEHKVQCALFKEKQAHILYPFVQRSLGDLLGSIAHGINDASGLYGRNGLVHSGVTDAILSVFHDHYQRAARAHGIMCQFDRFHPILENQKQAFPNTDIKQIGDFITVDLRPSLDLIEADFKKSVRYDLKKAERNNIKTEIFSTEHEINQFHDIYTETMERNNSGAFYKFNRGFFQRMRDLMPQNCLFVGGFQNAEMVSGDIIIYDGDYAHLYFSGTLQRFLPTAANLAVRRTAIHLLKDLGCKYFLLGGGVMAGDGLEKFKLSFATSGARPSLIGGTIFDPERYDDLKGQMVAMGTPIKASRFQFYDL
jgi:hypothetical protein